MRTRNAKPARDHGSGREAAAATAAARAAVATARIERGDGAMRKPESGRFVGVIVEDEAKVESAGSSGTLPVGGLPAEAGGVVDDGADATEELR